MKIIKTLVASAFLMGTLGAQSAQACSFYIDSNAVSNELIAAAVSDSGHSLTEVTSLEVDGYQWEITKNSPMCPKEITHTAQVSFKVSEFCGFSVAVKKVDSWENRIQDFTFETIEYCR